MRKSGALTLFAAVFFAFGLSQVALGQDKSRERRELVETDALDQPLPPNVKLKVFIHHPKAKGPQLGTCSPTSSDSSDFDAAGWHLPTGGITWMLNTATVPGSIGGDARAAAPARSL